MFTDTWRPPQWQHLTFSFLIWKRYQRSRTPVLCSPWTGAELRYPLTHTSPLLFSILITFFPSFLFLLLLLHRCCQFCSNPHPPTRCSPTSSLFSAPSSPASSHKLDIFQLFPFLVQNRYWGIICDPRSIPLKWLTVRWSSFPLQEYVDDPPTRWHTWL